MSANKPSVMDSVPLLSDLPSEESNHADYQSIEVEGTNSAQITEKSESSSSSSLQEEHKTTTFETFVHLLKGYLGAGCLSLPWAISQLGLFWGTVAVLSVAYWSSYNCWSIVKIKRFIERQTSYVDDRNSRASSITTNTNVTYPDVGEWAYGPRFQKYVAICVCTQQLAISTVFISFVGENLLAVLKSLNITFMATHVGVITMVLPFIMALSLIPTIKQLTPVMVFGGLLLVASFMAIGLIIEQEWPQRPQEPPGINYRQAPLAVSAILYSYEGINLVLPVQSSMIQPKKFKIPFIAAMMMVAIIYAGFSIICVLTFGNVTNGSVTAFLLEAYRDDENVIWWVMVANTAVSLSVLFTYPLQLFPALELLAPSLSRLLHLEDNANILEDDENDLTGFEPLPPLPEHDEFEAPTPVLEHQYTGVEDSEMDDSRDFDGSVARSALTDVQSRLPEIRVPGDSPLLRLFLVFMTYLVAVIVPNVQALISLAGALAGSSSALLIPPMLELAWIRHLEVDLVDGDAKEENSRRNVVGRECFGYGKWWFEKLKCYVLLGFGFLFFGIGTFASVTDIARIYRAGSQT